LPSSSSQRRVTARRALIADLSADRRGWLQHGIAALGISLLGLGVAASVSLTGAAQDQVANTAPVARPSVAAKSDDTAKSDTAKSDDTAPNPRLAPKQTSTGGPDESRLKSLAEQRAEELAEASEDYAIAASTTTAEERDKALKDQAKENRKAAARLAEQGRATDDGNALPELDAGAIQGGGKACLPLASYRISARFGQVGIWSRYHTGFDFSAGIGSAIRAPSAGVVTNAGIGPASGWAGNYVAIKYPDGTQTLMAHMSTVSVRVGQTVSACQVVGAVGMTGRTFGPHLHFEAYPAGITPGDIYRAVSPATWLNARGLNP
jgi:murein DD-endopeptidase MepM/ murein hydrolase activator NlpD